MILNYFKIAFRNLWKQKGFSFINLFGLAVGIACCLMIAQYVRYEFSFDQFHQKSDRIYRLARETTGSGGEKKTIAPLNYSMADMLRQYVPGIESVTRLSRSPGTVEWDGAVFEEEHFFLADTAFFTVFDADFLAGNPETALRRPFSAVLIREAALQIFGRENPVGESFMHEGNGPFTVTGVVRKYPPNSHFRFSILASLESSRTWLPESAYTDLGYNWTYTYLVLPQGVSPRELEKQIAALVEKFAPMEARAFQVYHHLQPLEDIHLYSQATAELRPGGNATTVYALIGIALLVLLVASFNYVNLTTARALWRAREVGMRKTLGANRRQLTFQFLGESIMVVILAFLAALLIIEIINPYFNRFTGQEMRVDLWGEAAYVWSTIGGLIALGIAAGSYPALVMSGYEPSRILKGRGSGRESGHSGLFRKGMVAFQFAVSIFLVAGTIVINHQIQYAQTMDLGFEEERVMVLDLSDPEARNRIEEIRQEISDLGSVSGVAASSDIPPAALNSWRILPEGAPSDRVELMKVMAVDDQFLDVMDLQVIKGRKLSEERSVDREEGILLNESAVEWLGLESPLGTRFDLMNGLKRGRVVGVVEDFHVASAYDEIPPVFLHIWPRWYDMLVVKIQSGNVRTVADDIEQIWNSRISGVPFSISFLDDTFDALYREERRMASVMTGGSFLAIFIACLGLLGLISYTVERRTREIGIRKVLGASVSHILGILTGEFLVLFLMGFALSIPLILWIMGRWLQDFAYRISIGPEIYLLAGGITLLAAAVSIIFQALRAVNMNPVESLRSE